MAAFGEAAMFTEQTCGGGSPMGMNTPAGQNRPFLINLLRWPGGKGSLIYPPTRPALYCATRPTMTPTGSLVGTIDVTILEAKYANGQGRIKAYTIRGAPPGGPVNGITQYRSDPMPVDAAPAAGGFTVHVHADNVAIWEFVNGVKSSIPIGYISLWDVTFIPPSLPALRLPQQRAYCAPWPPTSWRPIRCRASRETPEPRHHRNQPRLPDGGPRRGAVQ